MSSSSFASEIAKSLPKDVEIRVTHLTHAPTACDPIFSPPPGEQAELTHFQSHFLVASIRDSQKTEENTDDGRELLVFAIEVLVYFTARLTTVFVSKADSTGYLYLLNLPPKSPSLIRSVSTAFLSYLVRVHQRPGVRLVVSLFARSQNQYLFPGSSENAHKHILDDRGLIKWWCRVFDPILKSFEPEHQRTSGDQSTAGGGKEADNNNRDKEETTSTSATAYLIVPGCDKFETKAYFPPPSKSDDNQSSPRWVNSYPLNQLISPPTAPARCLIPRFPDDPKARFLVDLDDEIEPEKNPGQWQGIKTLGQFWEMMSFRQECSAGRLVGFLWMVVNPPGILNSDEVASTASPTQATVAPSCQAQEKSSDEPTASTTSTAEHETPPVPGVDDNTVLLSHEEYDSVGDFLAELDFANKQVSLTSTASWFENLSSVVRDGNSPRGGIVIIGENESVPAQPASEAQSATPLNTLNAGLIRKRKRPDAVQVNSPASQATEAGANGISEENNTSTGTEAQSATLAANVLQPQLIRKKKKET